MATLKPAARGVLIAIAVGALAVGGNWYLDNHKVAPAPVAEVATPTPTPPAPTVTVRQETEQQGDTATATVQVQVNTTTNAGLSTLLRAGQR